MHLFKNGIVFFVLISSYLLPQARCEDEAKEPETRYEAYTISEARLDELLLDSLEAIKPDGMANRRGFIEEAKKIYATIPPGFSRIVFWDKLIRNGFDPADFALDDAESKLAFHMKAGEVSQGEVDPITAKFLRQWRNAIVRRWDAIIEYADLDSAVAASRALSVNDREQREISMAALAECYRTYADPQKLACLGATEDQLRKAIVRYNEMDPGKPDHLVILSLYNAAEMTLIMNPRTLVDILADMDFSWERDRYGTVRKMKAWAETDQSFPIYQNILRKYYRAYIGQLFGE